MDALFNILPLLIPILLIDLALAAAAVTHILKHPRYRFGSKTMWLVIAVILLLFGPILYLEKPAAEGGICSGMPNAPVPSFKCGGAPLRRMQAYFVLGKGENE